MSFFYGLSDELTKLAGEEGDTMYGHGDGKPSVGRGAAAGALAAGAATHAAGEAVRRHPHTRRVLAETAKAGGPVGEEARGFAKALGKPGAFHGRVAKALPLTMLLGAAGGAGIQGIRRAMHGEKKEAGIMGGIRKVVAKAPKKAIGAGLAGGAAFGAGHHMGKKKGEGEAVQVGEAAYGAGARDMANELMSELGIG